MREKREKQVNRQLCAEIDQHERPEQSVRNAVQSIKSQKKQRRQISRHRHCTVCNVTSRFKSFVIHNIKCKMQNAKCKMQNEGRFSPTGENQILIMEYIFPRDPNRKRFALPMVGFRLRKRQFVTFSPLKMTRGSQVES